MASDTGDGTKNVGNRNALLHGLYARDVLLPWESQEDFLQLFNDLKAEFAPDGRAEEEAVLDLCFAHWRKRTLQRQWQAAVLRDPFTQDIIDSKSDSWSDIRQHLRASAHNERTMRGMIDENVAKLLAQLQTVGEKLTTTSDAEELNSIQAQIDAVLKLLTDKIMPLAEMFGTGADAERAFERFYAPEGLEKIMRLDAALDARIAKVLARLVGLKEFKRTPAGGASTRALAAPRAARELNAGAPVQQEIESEARSRVV